MAILLLFGVLSTLLMACLSVAVLNVVVRRESAYLIEERIRVITENDARLNTSVLRHFQAGAAPVANLDAITSYLRIVWPETPTDISVVLNRPIWVRSATFTGLVVDDGHLAIRSYHQVNPGQSAPGVIADTPVDSAFIQDLSRTACLKLSNDQPIPLRPYRAAEGFAGEIAANFVPGSRRPIPVVVTVQNWWTGASEDWVICQVRLDYSRTIADLSKMGLHAASWVAPFASILIALFLVYLFSLLLSFRLSQRIGAAIDGLSHAAQRVGDGDLSVQIPIHGRDQLSVLARTFNEMICDLQGLREQEKQASRLEWELSLAREVQEHLYPRAAAIAAGVTLWGMNTPARVVSGDHYEFFSFGSSEVGLLVADVSGKGIAAALMMAHLQALVHGRLFDWDETRPRAEPASLIAALNRDFHGRFGEDRYVTMFYAEFNSASKILRYVNAGHCPAILVTDTGELTQLTGNDVPVGVFPEATYHAHQVKMTTGCSIVVYTDGVTDALNAQREPFGEDRLLNCCRALPKGATGEEIGAYIADKITEWSDGVEQFDDMTILVLSVK